jgi:hypothetical protein
MVETTPPQNKAIYFRTEKTDAEKLSKVRQYLVNQLDLNRDYKKSKEERQQAIRDKMDKYYSNVDEDFKDEMLELTGDNEIPEDIRKALQEDNDRYVEQMNQLISDFDNGIYGTVIKYFEKQLSSWEKSIEVVKSAAEDTLDLLGIQSGIYKEIISFLKTKIN